MRLLRQAARAGLLLVRQGPAALARRAAYEARRAIDRRLRPAPHWRDRLPLPDLLGMTSPEERAWLAGYARAEYTGAGELVDLGCWFGSSTVPLAVGLAANPRVADRRRRIHAFDLFRWETWMEDSLAGSAEAGRFAEGDSFLPLFERQVAAWQESIAVYPGDLTALGWPPARPIELLFDDAAKSWELANAIRRDFFPSLVPGLSLLVEQDFCHFYTPWVHLVHFRLRDSFEPLFAIPYSGSMVFRCRSRPRPELLDAHWGFADFADDEIEAAFERSLALVPETSRPNVWAARAMLEIHRERPEAARRLLAEGDRRGLRGLDLDRVASLLAKT